MYHPRQILLALRAARVLWLAFLLVGMARAPGVESPGLAAGLPPAKSAGLFPAEVKRVLFLGDSITYAGQYVEEIAAYHHARFPDRRIEFINLGLPSETVSGLSEPGHAGGKFPRPDLHERLGRVLDKTKPDLVFACYGMNDGIYQPFDAARFQAFQDGIAWLRAQVTKAGARIVLITPPIFDEVKGGHQGYARVLDRYSEWLVGQRAKGWDVVDLHTPMKVALAEQRAREPAFALSTDGIHPDAYGHWLMARQILLHLDARDAEAAGSPAELMRGFAGGDDLLRRERKEMSTWKDAWLSFVGHKRPGMKRGAPMEIDPETGQARLLPPAPVAGAGVR